MRPAERGYAPEERAFDAGWCCPYCAAPLLPRGAGLCCEAEGRLFASSAGVYRLLEEKRRSELLPFLELEHRVRRDEGFRATPGLPEQPKAGPLASLWRRRARRLHEGLRLAAQTLAAGHFDLVLAVDALHHARRLLPLLVELRRVTRRLGALLVLESPVYARREDGEADVARRMRWLHRRYGLELPRESQPGYFVRSELEALFGQAGYRLEAGGLSAGLLAPLLDFAVALLGRSGLPSRPVLFARRDG